MNILENSQPERTMSLMVDRPIPVPNTEYAYYVGELLPFNLALYSWFYVNDRYITRMDNVKNAFNNLSFRRKFNTIFERRVQLGFVKVEKTDAELKQELITILES